MSRELDTVYHFCEELRVDWTNLYWSTGLQVVHNSVFHSDTTSIILTDTVLYIHLIAVGRGMLFSTEELTKQQNIDTIWGMSLVK